VVIHGEQETEGQNCCTSPMLNLKFTTEKYSDSKWFIRWIELTFCTPRPSAILFHSFAHLIYVTRHTKWAETTEHGAEYTTFDVDPIIRLYSDYYRGIVLHFFVLFSCSVSYFIIFTFMNYLVFSLIIHIFHSSVCLFVVPSSILSTEHFPRKSSLF
jgi:hypothetical protein